MTYNTELKNCLIAITHKYTPQLLSADLPYTTPEFVARLRDQGVLIVIGDKLGHTDNSVTEAARDCVALYRRLYQYLAARLFPFTYAGTETRATLCQEADFVVLGLCAPAGPIVAAIDTLVAPFIIQNHAPPLPDRAASRRLAGRVLLFLETEPVDADMVDEIADMVEALCAMTLRPLPFLPGHSLRPPRTLPEFDMATQAAPSLTDAQIIDDADSETEIAPAQASDALVGPIPDWAQSL